jgi:tetratricopeptide (TPR) repeat protein
MGDVFAIQDEITSAIVDKLKPQLLGQKKARLAKRQTVDPEVYDLYLRGLYFLKKRGETNLNEAVELFELAIARDPNCALAYAGLAASYGALPFYSLLPPKEVVPKAREMVLKAIKIDKTLAQAHTSLGVMKTVYDWDWEGGEREFKQAIELNPGFVYAHQGYSFNLLYRARYDKAIEEIEQALELDPLSIVVNHDLGVVCICAGQFDRAVNALKRTLEMDSSRVYAHHHLGEAYLHKSMYEEALAAFQKEREISKGAQAWTEVYIGWTYVEMGKPDEAQEVLNDLLERPEQEYVSPFILAGFHFLLGKNDEGFKLLDKAYKEQDTWMCWLKIEPLLDSIRSHPKYTALLKTMNLDK